jgi:ribonuclease Z
LQITAFKVQHSVPCYGYRFDLPRLPKFDSERARSLNIPVKYWKALQNGESIGGYSPSDVQGEAREGIGLLYATDTRPIDNIVKHGKNLKLMILEGMYDDPIMKEKAEQTSHSTMQESVVLAALCRPSQLWLTHFSPSVEAPTEREHELKKEFNNTVIGYDGLSATLVF